MNIHIKKGNTGSLGSGVEKRVDRHETIIHAVVIVLLFMLAQLVIDSFRFNTTIYREYSEKLKSVEDTQKVNEKLLIQVRELSQQANEDREIIKQLLKR